MARLSSGAETDAVDASLEQLLELAAALREAAGVVEPPPPLVEWTELCQREQNNSFGLFDASDGSDELYCFGRAVYDDDDIFSLLFLIDGFCCCSGTPRPDCS